MAKLTYNDTEKKTLRKMWWNAGYVFAGFNMVKMEGNAFALTMAPVLEELYDNEEERKQALVRHNGFFNTHAVMFSLIAGITYALEKEKKTTGAVTDEVIENIKASLMGPTAGIGDAFFFNCLRVIAAGIGIGLCAEGSILGTIIFILIYGVTQSIVKYLFVNGGYVYGTSFIDAVFSSGLMAALTKAASTLGLMMVGAMTAQMVNVPLNLTLNIGQTSVVVQDVINSIFPGLLGLILLFILVRLIKKGARPTQLIFGIFVFALIGAFIHIF